MNQKENAVCLLTLLDTLFTTKTDSEDKCKVLENVFGMEMTQSLKTEIADVTNLGRKIKENGYKEGYEKGYKEGHEKGRKESIVALVATLKELGFPEDVIVCQLCEQYDLMVEEVQSYL